MSYWVLNDWVWFYRLINAVILVPYWYLAGRQKHLLISPCKKNDHLFHIIAADDTTKYRCIKSRQSELVCCCCCFLVYAIFRINPRVADFYKRSITRNHTHRNVQKLFSSIFRFLNFHRIGNTAGWLDVQSLKSNALIPTIRCENASGSGASAFVHCTSANGKPHHL